MCYAKAGHVMLVMKGTTFNKWFASMKRPRTWPDELMLYVLCVLYQWHCVVYTEWKPWHTVQPKVGQSFNMIKMCETKLLYIAENLFGVLKRLLLNRLDTPPIVLSDVQSSRIIDRDISENIHLTIIGLSKQRSVGPSASTATQPVSQPEEADNNTDIKPVKTVKTDPDGKIPLNIFGDAYADLIATKVEPMETTPEIEISDVRTLGILIKPKEEPTDDTTCIMDPSCALHDIQAHKSVAQAATHIPPDIETIPIDIVPTNDLAVPSNDPADLDTLQEATSTASNTIQFDPLPHFQMLQEATASISHTTTPVTLQEETLGGATLQEATITTTSDLSIDILQEATLVAIPVTSTSSTVNLQETTMGHIPLPEVTIDSSIIDESTPQIPPQDTSLPGIVYTPASTMLTEDPLESTEVFHTSTTDPGKYYECLTPSQDEVIYLHHDDIINRKWTVKLNRLTTSEIADTSQISTGDKDDQEDVADPNWPPKKKVKRSSRPCSKPSQSRIRAQKIIEDNNKHRKHKDYTPMKILLLTEATKTEVEKTMITSLQIIRY